MFMLLGVGVWIIYSDRKILSSRREARRRRERRLLRREAQLRERREHLPAYKAVEEPPPIYAPDRPREEEAVDFDGLMRKYNESDPAVAAHLRQERIRQLEMLEVLRVVRSEF